MKAAQKYNKKIEISLFSCIIIFAFFSFISTHSNKSLKIHNNNPEKSQLLKISNTEGEDYLLYYNEFWQKFNTISAVYGDLDNDSMVTQRELKKFKNNFLEYFHLIEKPDDIFLYDESNNPINPQILLCYLNNYTKNNKNYDLIIEKCNN